MAQESFIFDALYRYSGLILGRGSEGTVYLVERDGQKYAAKVTLNSRAALKEAGILSRVNSSRVVSPFASGVSGEHAYLIEDYVEGQSLSNWRKHLDAVPSLRVLLKIAHEIAQAVHEVHAQGVFHRDLKPDNIFVLPDLSIKLLDFGLADHVELLFSSSGSKATTRMEAGDVRGTLAYASPEQCGIIAYPVDARSDLYSLGTILFELFSGQLPYPEEGASSLLQRRTENPHIRFMSTGGLVIPNSLCALIDELTSPSPEGRPVTALPGVKLLEQLLREAQGIVPEETQRQSGAEHNDKEAAGHPPLTLESGSLLIVGAKGVGKSYTLQRVLESLDSVLDKNRFNWKSTFHEKHTAPFQSLRVLIEDNWHVLSGEEQDRLFKFLWRELQSRNISSDLSPIFRTARFLAEAGNRSSDDDALDFGGAALNSALMLEALAEFVLEWARLRPNPIIALDGLECVDPYTVQLLKFLFLNKRSEHKLKLVATLEPSPVAADLSPPSFFETTMEVSPLKRAVWTRLVLQFLGGREVGARFLDTAWEHSQGNPYLTFDFLGSSIELGILTLEFRKWAFREDLLPLFHPSDSVVEIISKRMTQLSEGDLEFLRVSALLGRQIELGLIDFILPELPSARARQVAQAVSLGVATRRSNGVLEFSYDELVDKLCGSWNDPKNEKRLLVLLKEIEKTAEKLAGLPKKEERSNLLLLLWFAISDLLIRFPIAATRVLSARTRCEALKSSSVEFLKRGLQREAVQSARAAIQIFSEYSELAIDKDFCIFYANLSLLVGDGSSAVVYLKKALEFEKIREKRGLLLARLSFAELIEGESDSYYETAKQAYREIFGRFPTLSPVSLYFSILSIHWKVLGQRWFPRLFPKRSPSNAAFAVHNNAVRIGIEKGDIGTALLLVSEALGFDSDQVSLDHIGESLMWSARSLATFGLGYLAEPLLFQLEEKMKFEKNPEKVATLACYSCTTLFLCGREQFAEARFRQSVLESDRKLPEGTAWWPAFSGLVTSMLWRGKITELLNDVQLFRKIILKQLSSASEGYSLSQAVELSAEGAEMACYSFFGNAKEASARFKRLGNFFEGKDDWKSVFWIYLSCLGFYYLLNEEYGDEVPSLFSRLEATLPAEVGLGHWDLRFPLVQFAHLQLRRWQRQRSAYKRTEAVPGDPEWVKLLDALDQLKRRVPGRLAQAHLKLLWGVIYAELGRFPLARRQLTRARDLALQVDAPWVIFECLRAEARILRLQLRLSESYQTAKLAHGMAIEHGWRCLASSIDREFLSHSFEIEFWDKKVVVHPTAKASHPLNLRSLSQAESAFDAIFKLTLNSTAVSQLNRSTAVNPVLLEAVRLVGGERGALFLASNPEGKLNPIEAVSSGGQSLMPFKEYSQSAVMEVFRTGEPLLLKGIEAASQVQEISSTESIIAGRVRSLIAIPLRHDGETTGVLYCDSQIAKGVFTEEDSGLLAIVGYFIIQAMESAKLNKLELEKIILENEVESGRKLKLAYEELNLKTRDLRGIFASIQQGVCIINENLEIQGEYSKFLETMFGRQLNRNQEITSLFFSGSSLSADQVSTLRTVLSTSIYEDYEFGFAVNSFTLPREFLSRDGKAIEIDWHPLLEPNGRVSAILCTLRDVSALRDLRDQAKKGSAELRKVDELLGLKPEQLHFFSMATELLSKNIALLKLSFLEESSIQAVMRNLHTLKGISRTFRLLLVSEEIHHLEEALLDQGKLQSEGVLLHEHLIEILAQYQRALDKMKSLFTPDPQALADPSRGERSIASLMMRIEREVGDLADSLGKQRPRVYYSGPEVPLSAGAFQKLFGGILHLVRNSLDHGFTSEATENEITLRASAQELGWGFSYSDNGRGMDLVRVRAKALLQGLISEAAPWEEVVQSIFAPGFSTREEVTEISGRGVGMDAFRETIASLGGQVWIALPSNKPTLPFSSFQISFTIRKTS